MNLRFNDRVIIIVFLVQSVAIVLKSTLYSHGYLTADGCNYLSLAQNLLENNSFETNSFAGVKERVFFSVWPVGYPFLIFVIAKVTGISVFWSSKMLNILFIALIILTFRTLFKDKAYLYSLILLLAPFSEIFCYTFSEVPFISCLLFFSILICHIIKNDNVRLSDSILLILFSVLVFLSRYIGIFTVGCILLLAIYFFLKKQYRNSSMLFCSSFLSFGFMSLYFYNNYIRTGFITGMPRGSKPYENIFDFVWMISRGLFCEINMITLGVGNSLMSGTIFLLFLFVQVVFWVFFITNRRRTIGVFHFLQLKSGTVFVLLGLFYIVAIISARSISYFGDLDFRYLFPGTFFIIVGIVNIMTVNLNSLQIKQFEKYVFAIAIISFVYGNVRPIFINVLSGEENVTYTKEMSRIVNSVESLESGSVVIFGDRNLAYLRTDLSIASPFYTPNFPAKESWDVFLQRIEGKYSGRRIYVMLKDSNFLNSYEEDELLLKYDKSVVDVIVKNKHRALFQISP